MSLGSAWRRHQHSLSPTGTSTMVEEDVRGIAPSSFEISLPAALWQHSQCAPKPTFMRTTNHAEAHHKAKVNSP